MTLRLEEWLSTTEPGLSAGSATFPSVRAQRGQKGRWRAFAWRSQAKPKPLCGSYQGPPCNDSLVAIEEHRKHEAKPFKSLGKLADLSGWVLAGFMAKRL